MRTPLREARANISKILNSGQTVAIGQRYRPVQGFLVGVPPHTEYSAADKRKALLAAKAAFLAALKEELAE